MNKKVVTAFYLTLNIAFSIIIVLLNKWLYIHTLFPNVTLSMIHFLMTFVGLIICEKLDVFCVKDIDIKEMVLIAMTFCGFVVLTNLSLAHNTVGTYQVAKMLTTPCVIVMQIIFYRKRFSTLVKLTLIPITLGVVINFYYDIQFNVIGTIYAALGVLVTSLYQVMINRKQKEFQMDPMQLLYYQAPLSAVMLLIVVPILEPVGQTFTHNWSLLDIIMVILSGVVAFFVNLTSYWIIGKTSPLTYPCINIILQDVGKLAFMYFNKMLRYNMVGHSKFCLLLLGGSLLFHETLAINQVIGITLTLVGIILYAHVKMKDNQTIVPEFEDRETKPLYKV